MIPISFRSRGDKLEPKPEPKRPESPGPTFEQYYQDGAAVTTSFGNGVVRRFRPSDGFYEISLNSWPLANGKHATAILRKDDISHRIAKGCHEGYPVLTSSGVSGTLASVEPTTGTSPRLVCVRYRAVSRSFSHSLSRSASSYRRSHCNCTIRWHGLLLATRRYHLSAKGCQGRRRIDSIWRRQGCEISTVGRLV